MQRRSMLCLCRNVVLTVPVIATGVRVRGSLADDRVSAGDRAFIAKVSQGGMFEVEASQVATRKARAQNVIDVGVTEVHDHQLVGTKLSSIAASLGISFPATLNPSFQRRLDRLNGLSGAAFDRAYIEEMDAIHAIDVLAFADEARSGQNGALKAFAAETVLIVRRHIGALHAVPVPA